MPYIKAIDRKKLLQAPPSVPGELNYLLAMAVKRYIAIKGESYQTYNDIVGALECCKLEWYRRIIAEYENKKIKENGDVLL